MNAGSSQKVLIEKVQAVRQGDVLVSDALGTGSVLIATRTIE
jgi:CxxC motif-containing protein